MVLFLSRREGKRQGGESICTRNEKLEAHAVSGPLLSGECIYPTTISLPSTARASLVCGTLGAQEGAQGSGGHLPGSLSEASLHPGAHSHIGSILFR